MAAVQEDIRIQKFLADKGIASRRTIEKWIDEKRIKVDGRLASLGQRVNERQHITINGRPVRGRAQNTKTRVLIYNKPEGVISTRRDPEGRKTVFHHLPKIKSSRWISVGRLDINSRGLMIFTNNGDLANQLMHPRHELEREYLCRVFGKVDDDKTERLLSGVNIDGQSLKFHALKQQRAEGENRWFSVVVKEGKYREVRRMWAAIDCQVNRLIRLRYGPLVLPKTLPQSQYIELSARQIQQYLGQYLKR